MSSRCWYCAKWRSSALPAMLVVLVANVFSLIACAAEGPIAIEKLSFTGALHEPEDLSAVETLGDFLVVVSDEGDRVQLLRPLDDGRTFEAVSAGISLASAGEEIDIEGLAVEGNTVYVLGSHAIKRQHLREDRTRAENRKRLATVELEPPRHNVFRLDIDPATGKLTGPAKSISLRSLLQRDPTLGPFTRIPGKENGVNIEGIAARNSKLYLGFRSPVLRGGFVPVMVFAFDAAADYELRFVRLSGRGIRAMATVRDGFMLLAGFGWPAGRPFELYLWDGEDQIPGSDVAFSVPLRIAEWPSVAGGDPVGLAVLSESDEQYDIVVVHDVVMNGAPTRARIPK